MRKGCCGRLNKRIKNSVAELNEALGLSHVEEARLCALGVELREQVAALTSEKETNTGKVGDPESLSFYVGFDTPG